MTTCAEAYEKSGKHKAVLLAMVIGLGETIMIDTNAKPCKSSNSRRSFVQTGNI
jgi:hypothetical protein